MDVPRDRATAMRRSAALAALLAAGLAAPGCALAAPRPVPGALRDARLRRGGTAEAMLDDLASARMVYFGESHAHPEHHEWERRVLEGMSDRRGPGGVVLGMEMFERPFQPVLDRWVAGELSEAEFLRETAWYESWGYPWSGYRPLLLLARDRRIPVVALNAERAIVRAVGRQGLAGIDPWMRARIPDDIRAGEGPHRNAIFEIYRGMHGGAAAEGKVDRAAFQRFYEAQVTWDETMAESAVQALDRAGPDAAILVVAGSMHVRGFHAIPERARRRNGLDYRTVVAVDVADAGAGIAGTIREGPGRDADWYVFTGPHPGQGPRLGVALRWRTAEVQTVAPGSGAEGAGLRPGDVLTAVGDRAIADATDFRLALEGRRTGETIALSWMRDGVAMTGTAVLAAPPPAATP